MQRFVCTCSVCVYMSSFVCLRVCVTDCRERAFEVAGREKKQSAVSIVSPPLGLFFVFFKFLCIYCDVSLFLITFSNILITSACVPMAPVVFVQPKCA